MKLSRINIILALLLGGVTIAIVLERVDHSIPNYEFFPDMKVSPAKAAYDFNSNFANGRTLQRPIEGTIARGQVPLYYAATKGDAVRAGEELVNPLRSKVDASGPLSKTGGTSADKDTDKSIDENADKNADKDTAAQAARQKQETKRRQEAQQQFQASVTRGGETFRIFCISCHGAKGAGDGPVPKRGFPPPPSLLLKATVDKKDGQLFHILTYGQGSMSSFASQLTPDRRWEAINFVRSLQDAAP